MIVGFLTLTMWAFTDIDTFEMTEEPPGRLEVIGYAGSERVFTFQKWKINKLEWTAGDFENIDIEILIDCKSLHHDWKDLKKSIRKKKDYFYVSKFPTATASVTSAKKTGDGTYKADMVLSLKGITKNVPITFNVTGTGTAEDPYKVTGAGELNRRKFDFYGNGPKNKVPVKFDITLP